MALLYYLLLGFVVISAILLGLRYFMPKERVKSVGITLDGTAEELYTIISSINKWEYRKDLETLKDLEKENGKLTWNEYYKGIFLVRCKSEKNVLNKFFSIEFNSDQFKGKRYWEFIEVGGDKTHCVATQYTQYHNVFIWLKDYVSNTLGKSMKKMQRYLEEELKKGKEDAAKLVSSDNWGIEAGGIYYTT